MQSPLCELPGGGEMSVRSVLHRSLQAIATPAGIAALLVPAAAVEAQVAEEGNRQSSQVLVDNVDAPPTPSVRTSPDNEWMLLMQSPKKTAKQ